MDPTMEPPSMSAVGAHLGAGPVTATTFQGGSLASLVLALIQIIPSILFWIITFTSITLPTWLFTLFSTSLTITMNATTLLLIFLAFASTISWVVRYRYLNMYARLPPEPQRKEPQIDLFPDAPEGDSKRGLSNYLDEFLSAIKVFGYLERPVFHELTRTMQTRKLIAGETILLEEEQGFCLVVDGLVQIFVKSKRSRAPSPANTGEMDTPTQDEDEDDDQRADSMNQRYQLLTEVKNGAPMSSLFSILSLFTEDVKLRHNDYEDADSRPVSRGASYGTPYAGPGSPPVVPLATMHSRHTASRSSNLVASSSVEGLAHVPPFLLDPEATSSTEHVQKRLATSGQRNLQRRSSAHPDIVARATVDTTIAIIPATAFRRLTRVYPRASAHIVQVILTRLQRVTLSTGHAYLGLTSEVLRTEKLMNKFTTYDLPGFLKGAALERLKDKFSKEIDRIGRDESMKGIALHNPMAYRRSKSGSSSRGETVDNSHLRKPHLSASSQQRVEALAAMNVTEAERHGVNAGDLLVNPQTSRRDSRHNRLSISQPFQTHSRDSEEVTMRNKSSFGTSPQQRAELYRQESLDEDAFFREATTACMMKAIGLINTKNALRSTASVEQSPRLVSYDSKSRQAIFNNAFGFMDPFDASIDGDSESMASVSLSTANASGSGNIQEELSNDLEIVFFPKDAVLVEQGERNPGLYYVIDGFLDITVPSDEAIAHREPMTGLNGTRGGKRKKEENASFLHPRTSLRDDLSMVSPPRRSLYLTKPGGLAGYLGTISSSRSFVDVTAKTDVYVGFLPRASIERMVEKYPIVLLTMAKRLTTLLPRLILDIDFALEWVQVDAGQAIYRQGDDSDAIYIVLNGRLRSLQEGSDGKMQVIREYGQGDSVGELEVLTESRRPGTLHAIRDTELAKLPKTLFNSIALENPEITVRISKIIATRMRDLMKTPTLENGSDRKVYSGNLQASSTLNLRTVAILPVTGGVPVVEFSSRLMNALTQIGTTNGVTSLNQAAILKHLGRHAFSRMGRLKLSQHLADLEEKYGLVLYVCDTSVNSPWTQTCISQADSILLVGLAEGSPNVGEYERFLLTTKTTARKELVLLHPERFCPPGLTRRWLRNRMWINGSHHHVHMTFRKATEPVHPQTRRLGSAIKQRVQVLQAEIQKFTSRRVEQTPLYSAETTPFKGDFHRLARRLVGKSVGLVLGGGGARGIAHVGIIRAMEEVGVPIDIVGGTSIGAFVGGLYAWDADLVPMYGRAKKFAGRMGSMWRFALDLTYPSASYTTGHEFNRGIFKTFGTAQIEDFWLEFYCNTTNISKSRQEVHTSGYVWRYVRASMSLAGLVPPLCDESGSMLLDGGYLDNLTVSQMKGLGADVVFAVDVGAIDDQAAQNFGDSLSGFWAAMNRWNPLSTHPNPPTLSEIQAKLAYVSSIDALERAKSTPGCLYMRPPVADYGTLEFGKFDEIYQKGYEYGKEYLASLRKQGILPTLAVEEAEAREVRRTMAPRRASV